MLRKMSFVAVGLALFTFAMTFAIQRAAHGQARAPSHPSINIGATRITLTQDQLNPAEGTVIRAFVPTESLNQDCLATFAESNAAIAGATMFCAPREPVGLGKGLLISIFLPETPPTEFIYIVTVFQEGALSYGIPVLCNVEGC